MTSVPDFPTPTGPLPPPNDADLAHVADMRRQAREALAASDWRVVRDLERDGAVSEVLASYREALRAVARGDTFELPTLGQ